MFKGGYYYGLDYALNTKASTRNTIVYITNLRGLNITVPTSVIAENSRIL